MSRLSTPLQEAKLELLLEERTVTIVAEVIHENPGVDLQGLLDHLAARFNEARRKVSVLEGSPRG